VTVGELITVAACRSELTLCC